MRFYEVGAKRILAKQGIPVVLGSVAQSAADAECIASELGGPVVPLRSAATRALYE